MHNHTHHRGTHSRQADDFMETCSANSARMAEQDGGGVSGEVDGGVCGGRLAVEDVEAWLHCPVGLCPDQQVGADMLSVPSQDGARREPQRDSESTC